MIVSKFLVLKNIILRSEHSSDDTLGLNIRLFNEISQVIHTRFETQITITKESICRAIYFHGYLLEQTLKLFDITSFDNARQNINRRVGKDLELVLCRQILMFTKIIITKEDLYISNSM